MLACTTQKIEWRVKRDLIALRLKEKNLSSSCSCTTLFSGSITFTHFFLKTFIHYRDPRYMTYSFLLCSKDFQVSLHNLLRSRIFPLIHVNPSFELLIHCFQGHCFSVLIILWDFIFLLGNLYNRTLFSFYFCFKRINCFFIFLVAILYTNSSVFVC